MQKEKGFTQIILLTVVLVAAVGIGVYYYFIAKPPTTTPTNTGIAPEYQASYVEAAKSVTSVTDVGDLNRVSADLDSLDTSQIDTELNKLNAESSAF